MCVERQEPYSAGKNEMRLCTVTRTNTLRSLLIQGKQVIACVSHSSTYSALNEYLAGKQELLFIITNILG